MGVGPVTFLAPLALLGLLALPIIWWVLRITPPKPREQIFPPLHLLYDLKKKEQTPNATPFWLLLFRLAMGALLALALAKPILIKPDNESVRPKVLVIDTGWASAGNWANVTKEAERLIKQARRNNLQVALVFGKLDNTAFAPASEALRKIKSGNPDAFEPDRKTMARALQTLDLEDADLYWLSDGIDYGHSQTLRDSAKSASAQSLFIPDAETAPVFAGATQETANGFRISYHRVDTSGPRVENLVALDAKGRVLARTELRFGIGDAQIETDFELPAELRNRITMIRPESYASAGAVKLLDDSWGRPLIGLLHGSDANALPLLSEWHYIEKALSPVTDIYKGDLDQLLVVSPSIIFMTDRARIESKALEDYVEKGGFLIRFAGPKLAKRTDALLPVSLRSGGRELGGALAWDKPQQIDVFAQDSPFFGIDVSADITVKKQIMAQPGAETDAHTWARLKDGSPIITSSVKGLGRIVLFHVTAGPDWSELPLSGLYVEMLRRILPLARARTVSTDKSGGDWTAERVLDGYGVPSSPPVNSQSIPDDGFLNTRASVDTPPGYYRQGLRIRALNAVRNPGRYTALDISGVNSVPYDGKQGPGSLSGLLLGIAATMMAFDALLALLASGRLSFPRISRSTAVAYAIVLSAVLIMPRAGAQTESYRDALELHLAYVVTGDAGTDQISKAGLEGLAFELNRRTTIEPAGVSGVDIEKDTLAFYPFLYWPVHEDARPISEAASHKLNEYMAGGGTIVFDTMNYDRQKLLGNAPHRGLSAVSKSLDIPRLAKSPTDHILTKSFYLIQVFPGRWAEGPIWVEADQRGSARDGVSSVIVGANDWASAWAKDLKGRVLTVIEDDMPRQREFSYRFGVNLAMYALSGNYKTDRVHAATLIERLGNNNNASIAPVDEEEDE